MEYEYKKELEKILTPEIIEKLEAIRDDSEKSDRHRKRAEIILRKGLEDQGINEICRSMEVTKNTVRLTLRRAIDVSVEIAITGYKGGSYGGNYYRPGRPRKFTDVVAEELNKEREEGAKYQEMAERYGVASNTIKNTINRLSKGNMGR